MYVPKISVYLCACSNSQDNFLPENNTCTMHHHSSLVFLLHFSPPTHPTLYGGVCPGKGHGDTVQHHITGGWLEEPGGGVPEKTGMENSQQRYWDCLINAPGGPYLGVHLGSWPQERRSRRIRPWCDPVERCTLPSPSLLSICLLKSNSSTLSCFYTADPLCWFKSQYVFFTKTKLSNCLHHLHTQLFHFICNHITHCSVH